MIIAADVVIAAAGNKNAPDGAFAILAERVGFAYIPQAAVWLASQTLRILHAKSARTSLLSA